MIDIREYNGDRIDPSDPGNFAIVEIPTGKNNANDRILISEAGGCSLFLKYIILDRLTY